MACNEIALLSPRRSRIRGALAILFAQAKHNLALEVPHGVPQSCRQEGQVLQQRLREYYAMNLVLGADFKAITKSTVSFLKRRVGVFGGENVSRLISSSSKCRILHLPSRWFYKDVFRICTNADRGAEEGAEERTSPGWKPVPQRENPRYHWIGQHLGIRRTRTHTQRQLCA